MSFKSFLNNHEIRGMRNNNPGNLVATSIKWQGKIPLSQNRDTSAGKIVKRFEQFIELRYGIRALMRDLITDILQGQNTVDLLLNEYAPKFENNTAAYIATVAASIGINATRDVIILDEQKLIALTKAIIRVEVGAAAAAQITDKDYQDAIDILGIDLKKKKRPTSRRYWVSPE